MHNIKDQKSERERERLIRYRNINKLIFVNIYMTFIELYSLHYDIIVNMN